MSNPLRKMFETDSAAEKDGIIIRFADEVEVTVARAGGANKKFSRLMARLTKPYRRAIETETIDEKVLTDIVKKVYARTVVLGWKGLTEDIVTKNEADAEQELVFNEENCMAVFNALPVLFDEIVKATTSHTNFRNLALEDDAGN
jgi:hypothetical protein